MILRALDIERELFESFDRMGIQVPHGFMIETALTPEAYWQLDHELRQPRWDGQAVLPQILSAVQGFPQGLVTVTLALPPRSRLTLAPDGYHVDYDHCATVDPFEADFTSIPPSRVDTEVEMGEGEALDTSLDADWQGVPEDTYHHLVALAKDGDEAIFKDYARMVGVPVDQLDELWVGTRLRLKKGV